MSAILETGIGLFLASFASIISIANPFSTMAIFVSITEDNTRKERVKIAKKAVIYMFAILTIFLLAGTTIKNFFGISMAGIRVAGGLIILQAAWEMLKPGKGRKRISDEGKESAIEKEDVSFSPLAMPMLAGPGTIAVVIGLASNSKTTVDFIAIIIAIVASAIVSYFVLLIGPVSSKYIGHTGMNAISRMMGFILMAIAMQFILSGIQDFYNI